MSMNLGPMPDFFAELLQGRNIRANTEILKHLGGSVTHLVLPYLDHPEYKPRSIALYCLQHCWSSRALDKVSPLLTDPDPEIRRMAAIVIGKGEGVRTLARLCESLVKHEDRSIAAFALEYAEMHFPDLERTLCLVNDSVFAPVLAKFLCRYHSPRLHQATRKLLKNPDPDLQRHALAGLIQQHDRAEATRRSACRMLSHDSPLMRDTAAEYLAWHGSSDELTCLKSAAGRESDPYALGSMRAALAAIRRRMAQSPGSLRQAMQDIDARNLREPMEPHLEYMGKNPGPDFVKKREARMRLLANALGMRFPACAPGQIDDSKFSAPTATGLLAPISHYHAPGRTSFGRKMGTDAQGFMHLVHVGDDVGWDMAHKSVVAIAPGVVRHVACAPTWGCMVVIEHQRRDKTFLCSIYAHLSPFIHVHTGEIVQQAQKLGAIGRGFTYENGGYPAHLHFALHEGPFTQVPQPDDVIDIKYQGRMYRGRVTRANAETTWAEIMTWRGIIEVHKPTAWLCGYVSRYEWNAQCKWLDPQELCSPPALA